MPILKKNPLLLILSLFSVIMASAQNRDTAILLHPDRVFDGETLIPTG